MWCLGTNAVVTRDQFTIVPVTKELADHITRIASRQGLTRGNDPGAIDHTRTDPGVPDVDPDLPILPPANPGEAGLMMIPPCTLEPVESGVTAAEPREPMSDHAGEPDDDDPAPSDEPTSEEPRRPRRLAGLAPDNAGVFKISVREALAQRPTEARQVIEAELRQMLDKGVWAPIHVSQLSDGERKVIIRSSMFLKDKYLASGEHEKLKARLVAGGDQQDKSLYEDLSSPMAATSSVLIIAAVAASEQRHVGVTDNGGAFMNAYPAETGVAVHMRLRKERARLLCDIDPTYKAFVEPSGSFEERSTAE